MKKIGALCMPLLLASVPAPGLVQSASAPERYSHSLIGSTIGIDHVSLWAKDSQYAEAQLEQLGFNLTSKPGSYGAGISNKLIWFENRSYIEFLWLSDAAMAQKEAPEEHAFATRHGGVREYAFQVESAPQAYETLTAAGFRGEIDGSENWDPDGPEGPKPPQPSMWRNIFLERGQLPGGPFFIQYSLPADHSFPAHYHPNSAQRISSIWIVVADLEAAQKAYGKARFKRSRTVALPELGASGVALSAGSGEIFLLRPDKDSSLRQALLTRGDHVAGFTVKVAKIEDASRFIETSSSPTRPSSLGPFGPWVVADVSDKLGVTIAFHE